MTCLTGITSDIINDCTNQPIGGIEQVVYAFNREDLSATVDSTNPFLLTALAVAVGSKGYKIQGFKKTNNAGFDLEVEDTMPDKYPQFFSAVIWGIDSDTVQNLNNLNDIVIVVQNKNKGVSGSGAFEVYGFDTGLYKSSLTKRSNDNGGTFQLEMTSLSGEAPTKSHYVLLSETVAATVTMLESLMEIQANPEA